MAHTLLLWLRAIPRCVPRLPAIEAFTSKTDKLGHSSPYMLFVRLYDLIVDWTAARFVSHVVVVGWIADWTVADSTADWVGTVLVYFLAWLDAAPRS